MNNNIKSIKSCKNFKLFTAVGETVLGIPIWGGMVVISLSWSPLLIMLILHIITLVKSGSVKGNKAGSIFGIITSLTGWIPIVGMIFHIITAILLWIEYVGVSKIENQNNSLQTN